MDKFPDISLPPVDEESNIISKAKYDDLIESLKYVTDQHHHAFYESIKYSTDKNDKDYALASRSSSDDEGMSD